MDGKGGRSVAEAIAARLGQQGQWGKKRKHAEVQKEGTTLRGADWNVPVVRKEDIAAGVSGVAWVSWGDYEAMREKGGAARAEKAAVVVRWRVGLEAPPSSAVVTVPVLRGGRLGTLRAYLIQLGTGVVAMTGRVGVVAGLPPKPTVQVVVEVPQCHAQADYKAIVEAVGVRRPEEVKRRVCSKLGLVAGDIVDIYNIRAVSFGRTGVVAQSTLRVSGEAAEAALKASGEGGVFVRPFFAAQGDRSRYAVVPLRGRSLAEGLALVKGEGREKYRGLALLPGGLGVRVEERDHGLVAQALGGTAPNSGTGREFYDVVGVPRELTADEVVAALRDGLQWEVTAVRCWDMMRARGWVVAATSPPEGYLLQHGSTGSLWAVDRAPPKQLRPRPMVQLSGRSAARLGGSDGTKESRTTWANVVKGDGAHVRAPPAPAPTAAGAAAAVPSSVHEELMTVVRELRAEVSALRVQLDGLRKQVEEKDSVIASLRAVAHPATATGHASAARTTDGDATMWSLDGGGEPSNKQARTDTGRGGKGTGKGKPQG